jgi:hypothetical protein
MMDRRVEEGDGDGEDRGRIWGIGIDTFQSKLVSFSNQEAIITDLLRRKSRLGTYRLRGSLFCFARTMGLYDFITDSGTGVAKEDSASTSIAAAAAACPEALRLEKANC